MTGISPAWAAESPAVETVQQQGDVLGRGVHFEFPSVPPGERVLAADYTLRDAAFARFCQVCDGFHPLTGGYDRDVLGMDFGITMVMAENHRSELVWKAFLKKSEAICDAKATTSPGSTRCVGS